jgi:hypothetical protein
MKVVAIKNSGSARASRAGDGALAIANFCLNYRNPRKSVFRRGAETSTRGACAPQSSR